MGQSSKISILLASDFPILSESFVSIIKGAKDLQLVGTVKNVGDLNQQIEKLHPDVILLDISISCEKFSTLLTQISHPETKILVINQDLTPTQTIEALRYGAHGIIGKRTTPELLCKSVRAVVAGDIWVGREVTTELVQSVRNQKLPADSPQTRKSEAALLNSSKLQESADGKFGLTKRELQIVTALAEAQTNKDIAEGFGISEYTVKHHLTNIFDKLGVYNRVELALFAIHHQLCVPASEANPSLIADTQDRG